MVHAVEFAWWQTMSLEFGDSAVVLWFPRVQQELQEWLDHAAVDKVHRLQDESENEVELVLQSAQRGNAEDMVVLLQVYKFFVMELVNDHGKSEVITVIIYTYVFRGRLCGRLQGSVSFLSSSFLLGFLLSWWFHVGPPMSHLPCFGVELGEHCATCLLPLWRRLIWEKHVGKIEDECMKMICIWKKQLGSFHTYLFSFSRVLREFSLPGNWRPTWKYLILLENGSSDVQRGSFFLGLSSEKTLFESFKYLVHALSDG